MNSVAGAVAGGRTCSSRRAAASAAARAVQVARAISTSTSSHSPSHCANRLLEIGGATLPRTARHPPAPVPLLLKHLSQIRYFSTPAALTQLSHDSKATTSGLFYVRHYHPTPLAASSAASARKDADELADSDDGASIGNANTLDIQQAGRGEVQSEYWGNVIAAKQVQLRREDGSPWPWHCFRPADTYMADVGIDMARHYPAKNSWVDRLALSVVQGLRMPVDLLFKDRHVSHALLLETVAGVPGMVGGMLLHLRSLRRFQHSGGWIKALLEEAENERMHLMTWVEVLRPSWWERALVLGVQGAFFNAYFLLYLASPRLAHRFVGYLEEEAVRSYTHFLNAIDAGLAANGPAPLIAIDYWRLPDDATIRDVVQVIRADEAHHRDVNHFAADVYKEQRELSKMPAPIGYH